MKKIAILIFTVLFSGIAHAEGGFLSGNGFWLYVDTEAKYEKATGQELTGWANCMYDDALEKEMVDGREYSVIRRMTAPAGVCAPEPTRYFHVREADGKVYGRKDEYVLMMETVFGLEESDLFWEDCGNGEVLLYDFTLGVGDRYPCKGNVTVKSVEMLTTRDGVERKLFCLSNGQKILEDIGCISAGGELLGYQNTGLGYRLETEGETFSLAYRFGCLAECRQLKDDSIVYQKGDVKQGGTFLEYGKEWVYDAQPEAGYSFRDRYYIDGDTVVADRECMRLFAERKQNYNGDQRVQKGYEGALYEDGSKVYYIQRGKQEPVLIYDFGLEVGETVWVPYPDGISETMKVTITKASMVSIGGDSLRVLQYSCDRMPNKHGGLWIEGIGGLQALVPPSSYDSNVMFMHISTLSIGGEEIAVDKSLRKQARSECMEYRPMLVDGRCWKYRYHHFEESEGEDGHTKYDETVSDQSYYLDGDTIVGGEEWRKMYCEMNGKRSYAGAWTEKDLKVYCIQPGSNEQNAELRFDFNFLPYEYSSFMTPLDVAYFSHVDTISVNGELYLRHNFLERRQLARLSYVEGIGGMHGLYPFPLPSPTCICDYEDFVGVFEGDKCIFKPEDFSREGYTSGIGRVSNNPRATKHDDAIYSIQGNKVTKSQGDRLPKGVYIQNGRKFVVK